MDCAEKKEFIVYGIDIDNSLNRNNVIIEDFFKFNKEYDGIFSSMFLEHVNHFRFFEKVEKLCIKKLVVMTERPSSKFWDSPNHLRPYTTTTLRLLFQNSDFKVLKCKYLYPTNAVICIGEKYPTK